MRERLHASFFSGVGGLDRGLEAAGWKTVSFSEIDPYASAVLARHWPDTPNLGDIVALAARGEGLQLDGREQIGGLRGTEPLPEGGVGPGDPVRPGGLAPWQTATLWSGGFPCQDLSVAGKRRGFGLGHGGADTADTRSGLAFAFLDLLADELAAGRGPEYVLLENVPGLLSSHAGRDFGALLGEMAELGYGVAWRIYDARFFGVPQRRRRVFILGVRSGRDDPDGRLGALRASEILSVGTRCERHPVKGGKKGSKTATGTGGGTSPTLRVGAQRNADGGPGDAVPIVTGGRQRAGGDAAGLRARLAGPAQHDERREPGGIDQAPDSDRVREADGVGRRLDDRPRVEGPQAFYIAPESGQGADLTAHEVDTAPAITVTEYERQTDRGIRVVHQGLSENQRGELLLTNQAHQLVTGGGKPGQGYPAVFTKVSRPHAKDGEGERWAGEQDIAPTLNAFDMSDTHAVTLVKGVFYDGLNQKLDDSGIHRSIRIGRDSSDFVVAPEEPTLVGTLNSNRGGGWRYDADQVETLQLAPPPDPEEDPLLPVGLDSNRYRCCGNGVVSPVAYWIGKRLAEVER